MNDAEKLDDLFAWFLEFLNRSRPQSLRDKTVIIPADLKAYFNRLEAIILGMLLASSLTKEQIKAIVQETLKDVK